MSTTDHANQALTHLRRLSAEIGSRPVGTPAHHAAAAYITEVLGAAGYRTDALRTPCPQWQAGETVLEAGGERLTAAANAFSPAVDLTAPAVAVCSLAELAAAELAGRVALLYGDLTAETLLPKAYTLYESEHSRQIVALLEEKRPAAVLTVNHRPGSFVRLIIDPDFALPSATVPPETGLALLRRPDLPVRLRIDARRGPGYGETIVGRLGTVRRERLVLCAHFDTTLDSPGALDNAAGVGCLLALAEGLAATRPEIGVECIAFGDHEHLGHGNEAYVRLAGDTFDRIVAVLNLDGVGYRLGTSTVALMSGSEALRAVVDGALRGQPGVIWTEPWVESDHSTFAFRGVPSIALSSRGVSEVSHGALDTLDLVGAGKIAEVLSVSGGIIDGIRDKQAAWTRPANNEGEN